MIGAPLPKDENARVAALHEFDVLDTLPEQAYDDITRIASQICGTPIAIVSLVDTDRQWFKSRVGLDADETPRDVAFCSHAILEPDSVMIVEDAAEDARFAQNPLVTDGPKIRFYAGAPLVTTDGHALGTLCVIDRKPHRLDPDQQQSLHALSRQVIAQLELRRSVKQLEQSRDQLADLCEALESQADVIERDLRRAELIQRSLLPHDIPAMPGFHVEGLYRPGRSIGGDLYDVVGIGEHQLALVIADAAGHGVSAALVSLLFKHRLRITDRASGAALGPAESLTEMNRALHEDLSAPGLFVTAAVCLLDTQTYELRVASAGHPPLLWLRGNGELGEIKHTGPALGLYADAVYEERVIQLEAGDEVFLYTDGLLDVGGASAPTAAALADSLRTTEPNGPRLERLLAALSGGQDHPDRDDVTMLLLRARSGENHFVETRGAPTRSDKPAESTARIVRTTTPERTFLSLEGRVTWVLGEALLHEGSAALRRELPVVIDLARCTYLDSTILGTLHELVQQSADAGQTIRIQCASAELRASFVELCMEGVLECCEPGVTAVPPGGEVVDGAKNDPDPERQRARLLRAHELLADLSVKNRERFQGVVESLRRDGE